MGGRSGTEGRDVGAGRVARADQGEAPPARSGTRRGSVPEWSEGRPGEAKPTPRPREMPRARPAARSPPPPRPLQRRGGERSEPPRTPPLPTDNNPTGPPKSLPPRFAWGVLYCRGIAWFFPSRQISGRFHCYVIVYITIQPPIRVSHIGTR